MKNYNEINVYEASMERIKFVFDNFDRVYLSFSGGKDSGVLLNLTLKYMRDNGIKKKLGIMVLDNEANYTLSLEFMHRIIEANLDLLEVYWCCLPITLPCSVSMYETEYITWGIGDEGRWVRPMPQKDYIVNIDNVAELGMDFYKPNMHYQDFWDSFSTWYSKGKSCANMIGIRTDESLNRFRAILNKRKETYKGQAWTRKNGNSFNCYPIYDWTTKDVWVANGRFDWDYNKLYDVFHKSGMSIAQMRVASPFMSESKSSLNMYRVIDPQVWARLCARVSGANFVATYGKQLTYKSFKLPPNHTWKSFTKFLLSTLPKETAENFKKRFAQSIKYWWRVGRGLDEAIINDLEQNGIEFIKGEYTRHGNKDKVCVRMLPPDHLDMLKCHNSEVTSWKRFAVTILKNDHTCKYLGLAPTQEQAKRQREIVKKYKNLKEFPKPSPTS